VLWLLCVSIETVSPALGVRGGATGVLGVGLNVVLVAVYFFLTWRAGQERT
jgi:preprotein translocase subunit SecF